MLFTTKKTLRIKPNNKKTAISEILRTKKTSSLFSQIKVRKGKTENSKVRAINKKSRHVWNVEGQIY